MNVSLTVVGKNPARPCPDCDGSGHAAEYGEEGLCTRCDGSGQIGPALA